MTNIILADNNKTVMMFFEKYIFCDKQ